MLTATLLSSYMPVAWGAACSRSLRKQCHSLWWDARPRPLRVSLSTAAQLVLLDSPLSLFWDALGCPLFPWQLLPVLAACFLGHLHSPDFGLLLFYCSLLITQTRGFKDCLYVHDSQICICGPSPLLKEKVRWGLGYMRCQSGWEERLGKPGGPQGTQGIPK